MIFKKLGIEQLLKLDKLSRYKSLNYKKDYKKCPKANT